MLRRVTVVALAALALASAWLWWPHAGRTDGVPGPAKPASQAQVPPAERTRQALDQVVDLAFANHSLEQVVETLRVRTGLNFFLDTTVLPGLQTRLGDPATLGPGLPPLPILTESFADTKRAVRLPSGLNCKLRQVKLRTALHILLNHYDLGYAILGRTVLITSADEARRRQLSQPVDLDLDGVPLARALHDLSRRTATDIVLDGPTRNQAQMGVTLRLTDMPLARAVSLLAAAVDLKAVPVGKALIVTTEKGAVALQIEGLQEKNAELLKATPGGQPTFTLPGVCLNSAFLGLPAPPPQDPGPAPCCGEESSRAVAPEGDKGGPGKKAGGPKEGPAPKPSRGIQILQKLAEPMDVMEEALTAQHTLREALRFLNERPDWPAPVTVDDTVFRAENPDAPDIYDTPVKLPRLKGVPRERVLRMLLNQIATQNATFLVRNGDILVTTNEAATAERQPVQAIFSKRSLDEALQELAEQTGISVVLDARAAEKGRTLVTATFRPGTILLNAVRLLADMADLKAVVVDNLVYVTLRSNSTEFPPLGPLGKRREAVLE